MLAGPGSKKDTTHTPATPLDKRLGAVPTAACLPTTLHPCVNSPPPCHATPLLSHRLAAQPGAVVLDVRPLEQFNICHLPGEATMFLKS